MSDFVLVKKHTLAVVSVPMEQQAYSVEEASQMADVHPDLVRYYCRAGLLGKQGDGQEWVLDDEALYDLRRIEHYRRHHRVNLRALPLLFGMLREIESLRAELRFMRHA